MKGIFIILCAYVAGEVLSRLIAGFIPGSVLGMMLLLAALSLRAVKPEQVKGVSEFMFRNMLLFFVPVCVGLMVSYKAIGRHLPAILFIIVLTTMLVLAVVGILQQRGGRK